MQSMSYNLDHNVTGASFTVRAHVRKFNNSDFNPEVTYELVLMLLMILLNLNITGIC